ncbi:unnamed protein product, partial [Larinioides sclopetarius]
GNTASTKSHLFFSFLRIGDLPKRQAKLAFQCLVLNSLKSSSER